MKIIVTVEESRGAVNPLRHSVEVVELVGADSQVIASRRGDAAGDAARKVVETLREHAAEAERLLRSMGLWSESVAQTLDAPPEQGVAPVMGDSPLTGVETGVPALDFIRHRGAAAQVQEILGGAVTPVDQLRALQQLSRIMHKKWRHGGGMLQPAETKAFSLFEALQMPAEQGVAPKVRR